MHYVIIPTYQERENIFETVSAVFSLPIDCRVVVVDDQSTDGTDDELKRLEARFGDRLHVIRRLPPRSFARSYLDGFAYAIAQSDCVSVTECDADGSHPVSRIPDLVAGLDAVEVVIGSRYAQGGDIAGFSRDRRLLSSWANKYIRWSTGIDVRDVTAGFVSYRASFLASLPFRFIESNGYAFQIEMKHLAKVAGARMVEVPIRFIDRSKGRSKMSFRTMVEAFLLGLRYRLIRAK